MKRILALVLACLMLVTALVACGGNEEESKKPSGTTAAANGDETDEYGQKKYTSAVPVNELDFGGEMITVYSEQNAEKRIREWKKNTPDGENAVDVAVRDRNAKIEANLNIVIDLMIYEWDNSDWNGNVGKFNTTILTDIQNNGKTYDVVSHSQYYSTYEVLKDAKWNMMDEELFPYFDFEAPVWNEDIINTTKKYGKIYNVSGDLNLSLYDATQLVWHNKTVYQDKREADDPADLQDLALDNKWFFDDLFSWADWSEPDRSKDYCGDRFGLARIPKDFYYALPQAFGFQLVKESPQGGHEFNIEGNQFAEDLLVKLRDIMSKDGVSKEIEGSSGTYGKQCEKDKNKTREQHFANGDYIFMTGCLVKTLEDSETMRNMSDLFCVLPIPMYDEMQAEEGGYATSAATFNFNMVYIPKYARADMNGKMISAFLQYAYDLSYTDVRAYYIERVVKPMGSGSTDDTDGTLTKSIQLMDIILKSVKFGIEGIYSAQINDIGWLWMDSVEFGSQTLAEAFDYNTISGGGVTRRGEDYEAKLDAFDAWLMS